MPLSNVSRLCVLLVSDDNESNDIQNIVKTAGIGMEACPVAALEDEDLRSRLEAGVFDAVLLDISLPLNKDDQYLLSRLRQHAPETPIIVFSDCDDVDATLQAVREGAQDCLLKGSCGARLLTRAIRYAIERNHMQATLRALSFLDDLTGVYNRRGFTTLAQHQMRIARRRHAGFFLVFIDFDGMKQINDSAGHIAGDQALIAFSQLLSFTFRGSDIVARMGGDEFAVITCDNDDSAPGSAASILVRLENAIRRHNERHFDEPALSVSCGAVFFDPTESKTLDQMLEEADRIMYANKRQKRARLRQERKLEPSLA
ncbi:MAG: GGDEF domain-containing response regulator [Zoogloeaceae bacterium]|jgi:diguanylate cyclase (GGDEF)-like protein|nr:GGDEF domain-containing response regulator [Zoogloeaceae bacterium]